MLKRYNHSLSAAKFANDYDWCSIRLVRNVHAKYESEAASASIHIHDSAHRTTLYPNCLVLSFIRLHRCHSIVARMFRNNYTTFQSVFKETFGK